MSEQECGSHQRRPLSSHTHSARLNTTRTSCVCSIFHKHSPEISQQRESFEATEASGLVEKSQTAFCCEEESPKCCFLCSHSEETFGGERYLSSVSSSRPGKGGNVSDSTSHGARRMPTNIICHSRRLVSAVLRSATLHVSMNNGLSFISSSVTITAVTCVSRTTWKQHGAVPTIGGHRSSVLSGGLTVCSSSSPTAPLWPSLCSS